MIQDIIEPTIKRSLKNEERIDLLEDSSISQQKKIDEIEFII